jgi:hypothetical protein
MKTFKNVITKDNVKFVFPNHEEVELKNVRFDVAKFKRALFDDNVKNMLPDQKNRILICFLECLLEKEKVKCDYSSQFSSC